MQENKNAVDVELQKFTPEQRRAILAEGKTIVSASAGSGKTTVMIEKIIRFIKGGGDVGEILAVTFTKKAASQMKEKLRKALISAIHEEDCPLARKNALKAQLDSIVSADISTIHSFCAKLLRAYFYVADIDNAFRVINDEDAEGMAMKNATLDELFEEAYESKDEDFLHLISVYWRKKSDSALRGILLNAYKTLRNRADYKEYLQRSGNYTKQTFDDVCQDLLVLLQRKCAYYTPFVEEELAYFQTLQYESGVAVCTQLLKMLNDVVSIKDYFAACTLQKEKFAIMRSSKNDTDSKRVHMQKIAALKTKIVEIYDELSKTKEKAEEEQAFLQASKTAKALAKYLLKFDEKFSQRKDERGALDYNDLEHKALALLQQEDVVRSVKEKYKYVFVDEYQDVNPVQEAIISKIGGDNLFLVGDVKQSIYGFRGSQSKFFVEKQNEFSKNGGNNLFMKHNFRSTDSVLDTVNSQFSLAMTLQTSMVDYAKDSFMERGGRYALNSGKTYVHFLPEEEKTAKAERGVYSVKANADKHTDEINAKAKLIKDIIQKERARTWFNADTGKEEQLKYADIAVLSRKRQGQIAKTVTALSAEGIPVSSASAVNICQYTEVKTLIDILSYIDNASQDIALCSALLSAMGNCTLDDLSFIRLAYREEKFFRLACKKYAKEKTDVLSHKLNRFYAYAEKLRQLSTVLSAGELLTQLITDTRMEAHLLSKDNGALCLKRIHRFIEESCQEEPLSVHAFLERLRNLDYQIAFTENGGEDSVKVLTMHASKGLEYPVVIVDDLNAHFKGADKDEAMIEEKYGLAPRAYDPEKMTKKETLLRRLHEQKQTESSVADELNLYYVALTRAKDTLHLLFKERNVFADARYGKSFAEFTDFSVWENYVVKDELFSLPKQERNAIVFRPDEELARKIMGAFLWQYPYKGQENLPVKSSATGLMDAQFVPETKPDFFKELTDDEQADLIEAKGTEKDETGKERGIAYHSFLERVDFGRLHVDGRRINTDELSALVDETYAKMQAQNVDGIQWLDKRKCLEILSNDVFYQFQDAHLQKEQRFLVSLPIKDTYVKYREEYHSLENCADEMLFQGAIDLLAVGKNKAIIVDYKYSLKDKEGLKKRYKAQLDLYRQATAKILKIPKENVRAYIVNIYKGEQMEFTFDKKDD